MFMINNSSGAKQCSKARDMPKGQEGQSGK
jgi:hypothetical protein